jgi:hypothetical protein
MTRMIATADCWRRSRLLHFSTMLFQVPILEKDN